MSSGRQWQHRQKEGQMASRVSARGGGTAVSVGGGALPLPKGPHTIFSITRRVTLPPFSTLLSVPIFTAFSAFLHCYKIFNAQINQISDVFNYECLLFSFVFLTCFKQFNMHDVIYCLDL